MSSYQSSVEKAFEQKRSSIIVALTGRTGSGCTTVSKILSRSRFEDLDLHDPKTYDFASSEERKYSIVHSFMKEEGRWKAFTVIEGSSVIFSFVLEKGYDAFKEHIEKLINDSPDSTEKESIIVGDSEQLLKSIEKIKDCFDTTNYFNLNDCNIDNVNDYYDYYITKLPKYKKLFQDSIVNHTCTRSFTDKNDTTKTIKSDFYTFFMQEIGNNIRCSGNPYESTYSQNNYYDVASRIDKLIDIVKLKFKDEQVRICIDAIRNPYEAYYFKDKYSSFYLISINSEEEERKKHLGNLDKEELESLDIIEYEQCAREDSDIFFHQNMQECLSISDIHLYNKTSKDGKFFFLTEQILKYIALMIHPGLITPTHIERCMQTAYIAKTNSGCLSRQVGATITGSDFSIKAIGWNDIPEGQVPCNLRCVSDYCNNKDIETYSAFELENEEMQDSLYRINKQLSNVKLEGLSYAFCFKDIYNAIKQSNNQVYTRALHAEENAFLQLSKYGGQGIKGGKLFCTASPCELCAKKAFQLGIKEIYYIDPYPGISVQHILSFGTKHGPKMFLFYGAIGDAFVKLFTPRMPLKDELRLVTGFSPQQIIKDMRSEVIQSKEVLKQ